jgi:hypothetical protein
MISFPAQTAAWLWKAKKTVLQHPPRGLDLEPSHLHPLGPFK